MASFLNKRFKLLVITAIIINIAVVWIFEPACPWKENFNIDCAGCGATRMFKAILKLDFYQAFRYNPLMFCLLIFIIIYIIYILIFMIGHKKYYKLRSRDYFIILIVVILFMILRNIPGLEFLKPTLIR